MLKYVAKRLWEAVPTTIGILLLTFALFNVVGGSPAEGVLGKNATAEAIAAFNHKWGYDRPLIFAKDSQFVNFVGGICKGDFGYSIENQEPVLDVLKRGVGPSLSLTVPMFLVRKCISAQGSLIGASPAARRTSLMVKTPLPTTFSTFAALPKMSKWIMLEVSTITPLPARKSSRE